MIEQIYKYFSIEMIYLWLNFGVLPFWFILIFFPQSKMCKIFTSSVFPVIIFSMIYSYLIYTIFIDDYDFLKNFSLYLNFANLLNLFENSYFLILFWVHFLALNLFCGGWMVNDYQKFNIPKALIFFPLIITYFIGPLGIFLYWVIKIFYAKKISLYDWEILKPLSFIDAKPPSTCETFLKPISFSVFAASADLPPAAQNKTISLLWSNFSFCE